VGKGPRLEAVRNSTRSIRLISRWTVIPISPANMHQAQVLVRRRFEPSARAISHARSPAARLGSCCPSQGFVPALPFGRRPGARGSDEGPIGRRG
jgi:hypothetical protein